MSLDISRRLFLKLFAGAAALGTVVPAMDFNRKPYVLPSDTVSWIGTCPSSMSFIGSKSVHQVLPWDGVGYPVELWNGLYGSSRALETYYDFDLANFNREVPVRFWHDQANCDKYPNVHTYVRQMRFGESLEAAIRKLNFSGIQVVEWV
jgi:hypothetical protein